MESDLQSSLQNPHTTLAQGMSARRQALSQFPPLGRLYSSKFCTERTVEGDGGEKELEESEFSLPRFIVLREVWGALHWAAMGANSNSSTEAWRPLKQDLRLIKIVPEGPDRWD